MSKTLKTTAGVIDLSLVQDAIYQTWDAIGFDVLASGPIDNEGCMEMVIDADRISMFVDDKAAAAAAEAEIDRAIEAHGYGRVLTALSDAIRLG